MQNIVQLVEIISFLGNDVITVFGNTENIVIHYLKDLENTDEFTLDWINKSRKDKQLIAESSKARAIVADKDIVFTDTILKQKKTIIIVDNPKMAIAKIGNEFFAKKIQPSIHHTAVIHPEAKIGKEVYIGPNAHIGNCIIGDFAQIHENVIIGDGVTINKSVIINAAAHIGVDGLGCQRNPDGTLVKFPHFGGILIEDNVEIGTQTVIARGVFTNTIIGKGSKINVGCFIAHNVIIGENAWISPKVNIAGSVKIGKNTTIFSGVIIRDQIDIGNTVKIGMGSVVTKNIPDFETWIGNPAKKIQK